MHTCKCINVKGIVHPKIKIMPSVMVFYFYTIIYSKVVLNLSEFAERKCYFEEQGKPNSWLILGDFHICNTIKVNVDQQPDLVTQIHQNILLCVQHKKQMNTGLGQHESE